LLTLTFEMTTEPSNSRAENYYEDDYYGTPTHTCRHCDRVFPARWTEDHSQLKVELLSIREAKQAANDGCSFYLQNTCNLSLELIDNPLPEPLDESIQLHLILEPRSYENERFLEGQALIEGHEERYCGDWYTVYDEDSCNSLAGKFDLVLKLQQKLGLNPSPPCSLTVDAYFKRCSCWMAFLSILRQCESPDALQKLNVLMHTRGSQRSFVV
jgi:hypothetical protein